MSGAGFGFGFGFGKAEQFGQARFGGDGGGGTVLGLVRLVGGLGGVGGARRGQLGAGLGGGGLPGPLGGDPGRLAGGVPGGDGCLLRVARGERGAGGVGVGCGVVEPARADRFGGLLLHLREALPEVARLAAGALRPGGGGGGVTVGRLPRLLEHGGAFLLLLGEAFPALGRRVQGADEVGGGTGTGGEGGGRVPLGLADRGGDPGGAVTGGAVAEHGFGRLPGGVEGAGLDQLTALGRGSLLPGGQGE